MGASRRLENRLAQPLQRHQGAGLVYFIIGLADHIGDHDGGQTTLRGSIAHDLPVPLCVDGPAGPKRVKDIRTVGWTI